MVGLISLEVYNSIFNITEENNKFEFYTDTFEVFSFTELKDELEEILDNWQITSEHPQDEIIGPLIISENKSLETERRRTDGYFLLLVCYARSPFREFESYPRVIVCLDEDDIQLILKQYNWTFLTC